MSIIKSVLIAICLVTSAIANASSGHDLTPKNGGLVAETKDVTLELVASGNTVTVYVRDHGKPVDAGKLKGKLVTLSGATRSEYVLQPTNGTLSANGVANLEKGTIFMVTVSGYEGKVLNVRFSLK